ncbi:MULTISPECIES: TetR/AcrR family transcriptional regulator [Actinomadura]|uniref:TetR/AcrR family transcriptional regulator n=1 Tax=Actinomadura yumaensis TaxID=111807 RepID=A0ABW2CXH7_9ACTN|nr:TetR/AcrR family transcriptional regulator [Actinomadura sp. J1-007]MWK34164.1 TetR family transcriptional regulator [Actinomadura sp. J1-007]
MAGPQRRRKDTRVRIQDVALELFLERGYDQTSLREIAERLGVTKAALYYHFKTKEDIVVSLVQGLARPIDELIAWARDRPRTLDTKRELLTRLNAALRDGAPIFRFLQENQAALRVLDTGLDLRERMATLGGLLGEPGAPMISQVRAMSALFTVYFGTYAVGEMEGDPDEKREALLRVGQELIEAAYGGAPD